MPSPRNTPLRFERGCRTIVFALIGWLLGASVIPSTGRRAETANAAQLDQRLPAWTRRPSSVALHANLDVTPSRTAIAWLGALAHSGHSVTWTGAPTPLAIVTEPVADPRGGARIDLAAPAGSRIELRDEAGPLESVLITNLGGSVTAPAIVGGVVAGVNGELAHTRAPDSVRIRSIVVVGGAGWEGKFVVAALEERGWPVIARFTVAPNVDVRGGALVLDTANVAAVIAVDTVFGNLAGAIARFVQSGGGLILAGSSSAATAAASLAPGTLGARLRPPVLPADTIGLGSTGFYPVASLSRGAIALERRSGGVTIAARRIGSGRVMQVGYDDSWRWRMAGGPGSEDAHRAWWSRLVSAVAYAPPVSASEPELGEAPLASMVSRIGPARPLPPGAEGPSPVDARVYMTLIMILLLAEWASRRLRGLR